MTCLYQAVPCRDRPKSHVTVNIISDRVMLETSQQLGPRPSETTVTPPTTAIHPKNRHWQGV